jgi:Ca2+-binding RTX toxin-like protein
MSKKLLPFSLRVLALAGLSSLTAPALAAEGNVIAYLDATGTLVVEGDALANDVLVGRTGENNEFLVTGLGTTTVNGATEAILVASSVRVHARRGNDRIRVDGNIPGHVLVDGGPGDDQLDLGDPSIDGTALMIGGAGNDRFGIEGTLVDQGLTVRGGPGDDFVELFFATVVGELVIETSTGNDTVALRRVDAGALTVSTGHSADEVRILESSIDGNVRVAAGTGDDLVELGPELVVGGSLEVALSDGTDVLTLVDIEVTGPATLHGGNGEDTLVDDGGNVFLDGPPTIKGF